MIQFITDAHNKTQFAILPIADYERVKHLLSAEIDNLDRFHASLIEEEADAYELAVLADHDVSAPTIPQAVMNLMVDGMTPVAAWRTYRNMTQAEAAKRLGVGQSAYSKLESRSSEALRVSSRAKLAELFDCHPSNLL